MRQNPDGFACAQSGDEEGDLLIASRVGFAEALLPFRYMDGT
jgi:hypothetical protein